MQVEYISDPSKEGFVVIGAGLPRTGTSSLRAALSHLLKGPVHHMGFAIDHRSEENQFWSDALAGQIDAQGFRTWFEEHYGLRASVDYPSSYFYK